MCFGCYLADFHTKTALRWLLSAVNILLDNLSSPPILTACGMINYPHHSAVRCSNQNAGVSLPECSRQRTQMRT